MKEEEIQQVLDELYKVKPERLNERTKRLYDAIMSIADERDRLRENIYSVLELLDQLKMSRIAKDEIAIRLISGENND